MCVLHIAILHEITYSGKVDITGLGKANGPEKRTPTYKQTLKNSFAKSVR